MPSEDQCREVEDVISEDDHVWRFALDKRGSTGEGQDPLLEMVRIFLRDFLRIGSFTHGNARVNVDGFTFNIDPDRMHGIYEPESGGTK